MIEAISANQNSTRKSLQLWAASMVRSSAELHTPAKPVALQSPVHSAGSVTLESPASYSGPHIVTCRCSLCSPVNLGTTGSAVGGNGVVEINLSGELSHDEKSVIDKLSKRDAEVRRHEQAHVAAAGSHVLGSPSYTYQVGPDGQRYAIGGEVQIDLSPVSGDPEATVQKAQQLQVAALAPSNPSATDRQVAMLASRMAREALQQLAAERTETPEEMTPGAKKRESAKTESQNTSPSTDRSEESGQLSRSRDWLQSLQEFVPPGSQIIDYAQRNPGLDIYA